MISGSQSFFPASKVLDIATCLGNSPTLFASGHFDKKLRFWDGRSVDNVKLVEMAGRITSLDVSMSGYELLISTRDDTITLMDLRNFKTLHCYRLGYIISDTWINNWMIFSAENYRTSSDLSRVVLSSGNEYIAAGSANGSIFVWNKNNTKLEKRLTTGTEWVEKYKKVSEKWFFRNPIFSVSWNPTGYGVLSASKQKIVSLWK